MASGPITSWQIDGETVETVADFIFLGSRITADGVHSHEIACSLKEKLWPTSTNSHMDVNLSKLQELVMERKAWHAAVHGVTKSRTQLSDWTELMLMKKTLHLIIDSIDGKCLKY